MIDKPKTDLQLFVEAWQVIMEQFAKDIGELLDASPDWMFEPAKPRRKRTKWPPHANLRDFRRQ